MTDSDAARSSDAERAFVDLVQTHQASVWRYLRFLGCDETHADDLTQETFLAVWEKPFEDRGAATTRSYLRRVARNRFLMAVRRRRARPVFQDLETADAAWVEHDADDGDGHRAALTACLDGLSGRSRRALELFYREGAGRSRIAEDLELTTDGVKTLMRRAREALRRCIGRRLAP